MKIEKTEIPLSSGILTLRSAEKDDALMLLDYLKKTAEETRFLRNEPNEINLAVEDEQKYIENVNDAESRAMILGFLDGEYVGNCSFISSPRSRIRHRATIGIALFQKFTGLGIGTVMLNACLDAAKKAGVEQAELEVVSQNSRAIGLYKKLGFTECGRIPDADKYTDGTYDDVLLMVKKL